MHTTTSYAIKIDSSHAEYLRKVLLQNNILRTDLRIKKDSGFVFLPITSKEDIKDTLSNDQSFVIVKNDFEIQETRVNDYKELISLPNNLQDLLPTSFDLIGSIILIKLDDELIPSQSIIGKALLQTHSHVESVYRIKAVSGELRTRSTFHIAGIKQNLTIHKEYGLFFEVNIDKTYFNPRLATERMYIASQVKNDENILDMFTGVAPFPIMISRYAKPKSIIAVDKNRDAIVLAEKNIKRNKIETDIRLFHDDAKNIPDIIKLNKTNPDRIIMNLPFHAHDFFLQALQCVKQNAVIHLYTIGSDDIISERIENLYDIAKSHSFSISIQKKREIKTYAPHEFYMGIDITAKKN
ncbi:hypothetical protein B6U98_04435 [Thermoplasmatales archaeon ex4572_165]|nr:MAG: hypothetical protein B6U98_04435 [Thermoplasmatales archaeon ex4572_165]